MTTDAKPPTSQSYKPAFTRLLKELGIDAELLPRQRELELIAVKAFTRGIECGYERGFEDGREEADEETFNRGRNEGFADGYEDGYSAGLKEAS